MLLLLDDADMPLDQTYDTGNGRVVKVGGIRVQDSHAGFNDMDFRTAVAQSSNVYFAKAIWERYADNKERYSDFMKKLHLDQTVGLEAFGEKNRSFRIGRRCPTPTVCSYAARSAIVSNSPRSRSSPSTTPLPTTAR